MRNTQKLESLALAIATTNGGFDVSSEAWGANNPGSLKSFKAGQVGTVRRFLSWSAGFKALVFDLQLKCSGESRAHIEADSPLSALLLLFGIKEPRKVANWLKRAIGDESISADTQIHYFVER